jgi:hypothetical protein
VVLGQSMTECSVHGVDGQQFIGLQHKAARPSFLSCSYARLYLIHGWPCVRRENPEDTVGKQRNVWEQAEYTVASSLRQRGVRCRNVGHLKFAWDVATSGGLKIDVKFSDLTGRGRRVINLRRRGEKLHGKPNFFVVVLRGVRGPKGLKKRNSLFVVLDANKYRGKSTLIWTVRSLLMRHPREVGNWARIIKAE